MKNPQNRAATSNQSTRSASSWRRDAYIPPGYPVPSPTSEVDISAHRAIVQAIDREIENLRATATLKETRLKGIALRRERGSLGVRIRAMELARDTYSLTVLAGMPEDADNTRRDTMSRLQEVLGADWRSQPERRLRMHILDAIEAVAVLRIPEVLLGAIEQQPPDSRVSMVYALRPYLSGSAQCVKVICSYIVLEVLSLDDELLDAAVRAWTQYVKVPSTQQTKGAALYELFRGSPLTVTSGDAIMKERKRFDQEHESSSYSRFARESDRFDEWTRWLVALNTLGMNLDAIGMERIWQNLPPMSWEKQIPWECNIVPDIADGAPRSPRSDKSVRTTEARKVPRLLALTNRSQRTESYPQIVSNYQGIKGASPPTSDSV